jgi:predicted alpha/beta-hydrolase family hydrolase
VTVDAVVRGPKRGADRAVLLAHGAGSDMHAPALVKVAEALADARIPSMTFNFPYRSAGRRAPDRPAVLEAMAREAATACATAVRVPAARIVLGGRSMGGRICSQVVGAADDPVPTLGLALLGYPLHPPGKPETLRVDHFPRLRVPVLFVSGTRDAFATPDELRGSARKIKGKVAYHWVDTGDHGFKPLKSSGRSVAEVLDDVATTVVEWVSALP